MSKYMTANEAPSNSNTNVAVVLTGIKSLEAVQQMQALEPDFILDDVSKFEELF